MKTTGKASLVVLVCAAAVSCGALAQQYKWKDERGRTQYGDTPPPGVNATALRPPPPPPAAGKGAMSPAEQEMEFRKRRQAERDAASKSAQKAQEAQDRAENCARAKEQLTLLQSGQRMARLNSKGERYFIDDKERASELAATRARVDEACK